MAIFFHSLYVPEKQTYYRQRAKRLAELEGAADVREKRAKAQSDDQVAQTGDAMAAAAAVAAVAAATAAHNYPPAAPPPAPTGVNNNGWDNEVRRAFLG